MLTVINRLNIITVEKFPRALSALFLINVRKTD